MKRKIGSMTEQEQPRRILPALILLFFFTVSSCSSFYHFRPLSYPEPGQMKLVRSIPGTGITVGVQPYHTAQNIHALFGHQGLWREHVIPVLLVIEEKNDARVTFNPHSLFLSVLNKHYRNISPQEAFDIAWQADVPYQTIKKTLYYTGLILFTIVTLGLGSMIWVLPTPFAQPTPAQTPFGRDLAYKAFPLKATVLPKDKVGGLLYFNLPFNEKLINQTALNFQVTEVGLGKNSGPQVVNVTFPLKSKEKSKVNPVFEMLRGFF